MVEFAVFSALGLVALTAIVVVVWRRSRDWRKRWKWPARLGGVGLIVAVIGFIAVMTMLLTASWL